MAYLVNLVTVLAAGAKLVAAVTFAVPTTTGVSGYSYASVAPVPVGIS